MMVVGYWLWHSDGGSADNRFCKGVSCNICRSAIVVSVVLVVMLLVVVVLVVVVGSIHRINSSHIALGSIQDNCQ